MRNWSTPDQNLNTIARRWQKIEQIFNQALLLDAGERSDFVDSTANDEEMRRQIHALIETESDPPAWLEDPIFPLVAQLLDDHVGKLIRRSNFGDYILEKHLGAGSGGDVFLAFDTRLSRRVALKVLSPDLSGNRDLWSRFVREAKAAAAMSHPNVAHIYELGTQDEMHFLAMEYIPGQTLRARIDEGVPPLMAAVNIVLEVAAALEAAHGRGVVHRDIKPENIMIDETGMVKVLDFGLAKLSPQAWTENRYSSGPGTIVGTTSYMSPEQIRSLPLDHRTDLWSLLVVLYEMVSGHGRPFRGETPSDVRAAILLQPAEPLTDLLPPLLAQIVDRGLNKEIEERYSNATELIADLEMLRREVFDWNKREN